MRKKKSNQPSDFELDKYGVWVKTKLGSSFDTTQNIEKEVERTEPPRSFTPQKNDSFTFDSIHTQIENIKKDLSDLKNEIKDSKIENFSLFSNEPVDFFADHPSLKSESNSSDFGIGPLSKTDDLLSDFDTSEQNNNPTEKDKQDAELSSSIDSLFTDDLELTEEDIRSFDEETQPTCVNDKFDFFDEKNIEETLPEEATSDLILDPLEDFDLPEEKEIEFPKAKEVLDALGIKHFEIENYEADDIIGTFVDKGEKNGFTTTVVTGDRDLTQLASPSTTVEVTKSGVSQLEAYTPEHMKEVNGVTPTEFIDMKALMGDSSDNYPGVEGIGPKTASNLIQKYHTVENLYDHIDDLKASKRKERLIRDKNNAILGKKLATIDRHSPVTIDIDDVKRQPIDYEKLRQFYEKMNFRKFLAELNASGQGQDATEVEKVEYTVLDDQNVKEIKANADDQIEFYLAMLGANYHLAPFVGFALKINDQIYVSRDVELLQETNLEQPAALKLFQTLCKKGILDASLPVPRNLDCLERYLSTN